MHTHAQVVWSPPFDSYAEECFTVIRDGDGGSVLLHRQKLTPSSGLVKRETLLKSRFLL